MTAASSACSESDISSEMRGQIRASASASPFNSPEIRYCTLISNMFWKATPPFSIASTISPSRIDSRASVHRTGAPTTAATKNCLSATRPPEITFAEGAASVFLSASSHDTSPYNARGSIFIVPPGSGMIYWPSSVHLSAAVRMVPSPPTTTSTCSFCLNASANDRSIWSALPHHIVGSTMPAALKILSIFSSDSKSQPPLEVLIMAPTLNSDKWTGSNFI